MDFETRYPRQQCVKTQIKVEANLKLTRDFMIEADKPF
jgi:hypothetical protein